MRPLNLKISAFGPYAGVLEIPMERLGSSGIYLITGVTGAGKTTIYDAICFALFGEASGSSREAKMFRSKYAEEKVPTEVELEFSHSGKIYKIKRNPEYQRPSKHGNGKTTQVADATLYMPNGDMISKVKNVTKAVEEILGINKEQFSQIAMIAQGDFLKLLHANTSERINIFRELFKTQKFQKLEKKLDESKKEIYKNLEREKEGIKQYISGIQADEDDVLSLEVEKGKKDQLLTEDVIDLLEKLICQDEKKNKELEQKVEKDKDDLEFVNRKIGMAQKLDQAKNNLKIAREKILVEEPKLKEFKEKLDAARNRLLEKENIDKEVYVLESELEKFRVLEKLENEISALTVFLKSSKDFMENYAKEGELKNQEIQKINSEIETYQDVSAQKEKLKARLEIKKSEKAQLEEFTKELGIHEEEKKLIEKMKSDYLLLKNKFDEDNSKYEIMYKTFLDGQAGILAQGLKEGEKCPVCGSTSHPILAQKADNVPTEDEINKYKEIAEKSREKYSAKSKEIYGKSESLKAIEETLFEKGKKQLGIENPEEIKDKIASEKRKVFLESEEIKEAIAQEENKEKEREKLRKKLSNLQVEIKENEEKLQNKKQEVSEKEGALAEKKKVLEETQMSLKNKDKEKTLEKIEELRNESKMIQKNFDQAGKNMDDQNKIVNDLKKEIEINEESIKDFQDISLEEEFEKQTILNENIKQNSREKEIVVGRLKNNEIIKNSIEKKSLTMTNLEKKYAWVKALADTANGQLSSKEKFRLETFIQTTYFDRILLKANRRLMKMSSNQYELIRLKESLDTRSQSGLDLGVIDHYNGSRRSVKTLSGGESFMASLSMALGLSDVVQSVAGGIKIESLFIDEGFGSLDPESLDMAYKALASVTEGDNLVGIISHVADLKAKIDPQIIVKKEKTGGSSVEIVGV